MAVKYHGGKFPPQFLDMEKLMPDLIEAYKAVSTCSGMLSVIPPFLLALLTVREEVLSSKIEWIQAGLDEVLATKAGKIVRDKAQASKIESILNCQAAMDQVETLLQKLPPSLPDMY